MTAETKNKCVVTEVHGEGGNIVIELTSEELSKLLAKRTFLGFGPAPSSEAKYLVQYASFGKDGGLIPGYGSFK